MATISNAFAAVAIVLIMALMAGPANASEYHVHRTNMIPVLELHDDVSASCAEQSTMPVIDT